MFVVNTLKYQDHKTQHHYEVRFFIFEFNSGHLIHNTVICTELSLKLMEV